MSEPLVFDLEDEQTGLHAQFLADRDHPGIIEVVIRHGIIYRVPTEEERETLAAHPLFETVQADLILEASREWPYEWGAYGEALLHNASLLLNAGQAADA